MLTIILIEVVLPAPLGPRSPKIVPCRTANERLRTATNSSKRLVTCPSSMTFNRAPSAPIVGRHLGSFCFYSELRLGERIAHDGLITSRVREPGSDQSFSLCFR